MKSPLKKLRVSAKKAPLLNVAVHTGSLKFHIQLMPLHTFDSHSTKQMVLYGQSYIIAFFP